MALVLLNPHAQGGRAARRIPALQEWLAAHAPDAQLAAPEALQDSVALLQSLPEGSRVVVVGGDGTSTAGYPPCWRGDSPWAWCPWAVVTTVPAPGV